VVADFQGYCSPYDGKHMSDKALEEATKFAKPLGSNIPILSVIDERYAHAPVPSFRLSKKKTTLNEAMERS
jgi:nucleotide-binding universal stress UspA family protein